MTTTRRNALKIGAGSLLSMSLLNHVAKTGCALTLIQDKLDTWKQRLGEVSKKLGAGEISALQ